MKKFLPLLLLLTGTIALAEWVKIDGTAKDSPEKFFDTESIRQTGPMNTMRRVLEISNLPRGGSTKHLSIKSYVEYDCKDRRIRVLEENYFSEHWAKGESFAGTGRDVQSHDWGEVGKGSVTETIFNRVCPNDGS